MKNLFNVEGKVVLITGSGRGLGFAFAQGFAEAGATVVINDIDESSMNNALEEIKRQGGRSAGYLFDVSKSAEVAENIPRIEEGVTTREEIMRWFGPPSAFFNPTFLDVILGEEDEMMESGAAVLNDVYSYRYIENESTLFFIPILVGIFDAVAVSETLIIFFDENGRVEYHAYRRDVPRPGKGD